MDTHVKPDDNERMDIDEGMHSRKSTPTIRPLPEIHSHPTRLFQSGTPSQRNPDSPPMSQSRLQNEDRRNDYDRRQGYPESQSYATSNFASRRHEDYYERNYHRRPLPDYARRGPYDDPYYEQNRDPEWQGYSRHEPPPRDYYPRSRWEGSRHSPELRPTERTETDGFRSRTPPQFRGPPRDPRDRSPRSYPHFPRDYRSGPYREDYRDNPERLLPPIRSQFAPDDPSAPYRSSERYDYRDYSIPPEGYPGSMDRYSYGHYAGPRRERPRHERDDPFPLGYRTGSSPGHLRGRSMEERREPLLPPARELLSVSPELMMPFHSSSRSATIDPIDRSRSAGERLVRPTSTDFTERRDYGHNYDAPERILESIRGDSRFRERRDIRFLEDERYRIQPPDPETAKMDMFRPQRTPEDTVSPIHRSAGVTSAPPRTGFPSSGLRSTAPPTPPNPRTSQHDPGLFPPRFPGPSLGPIPPAPPRTIHPHSQPTHPIMSSRPHLERSNTAPERSSAPSPYPVRSASGAANPKKSIRKMVLAAVQLEEPPKFSYATTPGSQSVPPPKRAKSPPEQIHSIALPKLVPANGLPRTSAKLCLVRPPYQDDLPSRTKEQERDYAEWLLGSSTNVQLGMTRAVEYCQHDNLRAADELLFITHWVVLYLHQLGLSYYSQLRHEMRVAFWWKLNWSWFCIIQSSYDEAKKPIRDDETEPFPDMEAMQSYTDGGMEVEQPSLMKKEEIMSGSPTPRSSDQDTISEPMEDVVAQRSTPLDIPDHLREFWDMAKRLNRKPLWPTHLGENEWIEIGDVLVVLGYELVKYGLLDMDLGLSETEIMSRIGGAVDAWRDRDMKTLRIANDKFRKLGPEERRIMIMAIRDDERRTRQL